VQRGVGVAKAYWGLGDQGMGSRGPQHHYQSTVTIGIIMVSCSVAKFAAEGEVTALEQSDPIDQELK